MEHHLEPLGILVEWSASLTLRGFSVGDIPNLLDLPPTIEEEQTEEEGLQQVVDDLLGNVDDAEDFDEWLGGVRQRTEEWKDEVGDPQNPRHLRWIREVCRRVDVARKEIVGREEAKMEALEREWEERRRVAEARFDALIKVLNELDRNGPHNPLTRLEELIMLKRKTGSSDPESGKITQLLEEELDRWLEEESSSGR